MAVAAPWRQLPAGISPMEDFPKFWDWAHSVADPRVAEWPLMDAFTPTLLIFAAYVAFVVLGKKIMAHREAFDLKWLMNVYNVSVIVLNGWLFAGFVRTIYEQKFNPICNPVDYGPEGEELVWFIYVYYLSKILDLSDTVFMILRKKNDQCTFLHVYHHGMMVVIWWTATKWAGGGNALVGPTMNTFIHFVMYGYYLAATFKIKIPGKRYLTQMQMGQLAILLQHSILTVAVDCAYPHWTMYAQISFMVTLLILFGNFYVQSYRKGRGSRSHRQLYVNTASSTTAAKKSGPRLLDCATRCHRIM